MRTSETAFDKYKYKHHLFQALEDVNFEQVKFILQREPSLIDSVDPLGDTPLHKLFNKLDSREDDADIIQIIIYLLVKNAKLSIPDKSGETVLNLMTKLRPAIAMLFLSILQALLINPNEAVHLNNNLRVSADNQWLRL